DTARSPRSLRVPGPARRAGSSCQTSPRKRGRRAKPPQKLGNSVPNLPKNGVAPDAMPGTTPPSGLRDGSGLLRRVLALALGLALLSRLLGLLVLDAGILLGLGKLGLQGLLGDGLGDVDQERLGVGDQGDVLGQLDVPGQDLAAGLQAL